MADCVPGPLCQITNPVDVKDGTNALIPMHTPSSSTDINVKNRATDRDLSRAANAALQAVEFEMERHSLSQELNEGIGAYMGTEYVKDYPKQAKKDNKKASDAGISIDETNCITLVRDAVMAYRDALLEPWGQINQRAIDAGDRGSVLLKEFRKQAGATTVVIVAPNDEDNKDTLAKARKSNFGPPVAYRKRGIITKQLYDVKVPLDKFVNQNDFDNQMSDIPFAIGITVSNWGEHTFVFGYGNVYEVHYDKGPESPEVFQKSSLTAFMKKWGSVVIAVPPGPWRFGEGKKP